MSRKLFASTAALFSLINAIPGLVAPAAIASLYGVTLASRTVLVAQLLAASYIGYALINWMTRGFADPALHHAIDVGNLVAWGASAAIWIYAAATGMSNAVGWAGAGFTVAFTLGWAYFVVADRATSSRVVTAAPHV